MGDCLKSRDKMGLPGDLLLNWCRDGYFGPTQRKEEGGRTGEGGGGKCTVWRTSSTEEAQGLHVEADCWLICEILSNPTLLRNTGTLMNPAPTFPAEIRGIWRNWTNPEECLHKLTFRNPWWNVSWPPDWPASWWAISPLSSQIACFFLFLTS